MAGYTPPAASARPAPPKRKILGPTPTPERDLPDIEVEGEDDDDPREKKTKETRTAAQSSAEADLIRKLVTCYQVVADRESILRQDMREDLTFVNGNQWPRELRARRESKGRPCLTTNRLPTFIRLVVNQSRASKPGIQINPVDSGSDPDTAEVLQDICRHVEADSDADVAYERASEHQAQMGRGYIGVTTEYDDDEGFQMRIKIRSFRNPFRVFLLTKNEVDGKDAEECVVVEDIRRSEFTQRWPWADLSGLETLTSQNLLPEDFLTDTTVRIAEYWHTKYQEKVIVDLEMVNEQGEVESLVLPKDVLDGVSPEDQATLQIKVWRERTVKRRQVCMALCSGNQILEGNADRTGGVEWPSQYIPIIPVYGDETELDGRVDYRGMVRNAKDPQRMYNYWVSAITEAIALAPRAPYVGTKGQFKNLEEQWRTANTDAHAFLQYNEVSSGGRYAPPPQRKVEEPAIQAMVIALRQADNDLKAVMGLYDASLGERGPEESGKAILTRQRQGEIANSNFGDNLARAIRQVGRVVVDLAPKVYSVPTVMRLRGDDGKAREVTVYSNPNPQLPADMPDLAALKQAEQAAKIYNIGVGRYDVTVSVGPSFRSRRQEAVEAILSIINSNPNVAPYVLDILFRNSDWPDAKLIADRLERVVPEQAKDPKDGQPPIPPEIQQQLQMMEQQLKELQQAYQEAQKIIDAKQIESQAKAEIAKTTAGATIKAETLRQEGAAQLALIEAKHDKEIETLKAMLEAKNDTALAILEARLRSMEIQLEHQVTKQEIRLEAKVAERPEPSESEA